MALDLKKLEKEFDDALAKEPKWSFRIWLLKERLYDFLIWLTPRWILYQRLKWQVGKSKRAIKNGKTKLYTVDDKLNLREISKEEVEANRSTAYKYII